MGTQEKQLYYLSDLKDYKVDSSYADVRNWSVKDSALRNIGIVKNLLVNKQTERVVYLDVEVDSSIIDAKHDPYGGPANSAIREFINEDGQNHVILPIGLVDINRDEQYVFTESIDHTTFAKTKRIKPNTPIERDYETAVLDSYARRPRQTAMAVDLDRERLEKIKQRDNIGEYRNQDEETIKTDDDKFDWFDAENESATSLDDTEEIRDESNFYRRSEFNDSKFRQKRT